jgi:hypothetical protein
VSLTKLEPEDRQAVIDRFRDRQNRIRCADCGRVVFPKGFEIDHIVPEIESPEGRADLGNLQVLCKPCHQRKTAREAARYARANKAKGNHRLPLASAFLATFTGGLMAADYGLVPPSSVLAIGGGILGISLCTILVQNSFSPARPREIISPEPEVAKPAATVDMDRVVEAVRDVVGQKGTVAATETPGPRRAMTITYAATGYADRDSDKRFDLLNQIEAKVGGRWLPTWETTNDRVHLVERPHLPKKIPHPGLQAFPARPWNVLPVAPDLSFDLLVTPHILVVGETGSGKTALERAMIAAALDSARQDDKVQVILVDPKMIEFKGFRTWSGVNEVVSDPMGMWNLALRIEKEMTRRTEEFLHKNTPIEKWPRWIVFFDEYKSYVDMMMRLWNSGAKDEHGDPLKRPGQKQPAPLVAISMLLAMARKVGIHLVISTQSPDAALLGGTGVRRNIPGRAMVGPADRYLAEMMFGDTSVGRTVPSEAKGRTTFQIGDGVPIESQSFFLGDPADADPNTKNDRDDWLGLLRVGMPRDLLPDAFRDLVLS